MVRRKTSAPSKKDDKSQKSLTWNLGECSSREDTTDGNSQDSSVSGEIITIDDEEIEDENNDFQPPVKKVKKWTKRKKPVIEEKLQCLLNECDFYITVNLDKLTRSRMQYKLGEFVATSFENCKYSFENISTVYLYVSENTDKCFLYWESHEEQDKKVFYSPVECKVPYAALKGLQIRKYFVIFLRDDIFSLEFTFEVYLNEEAFCRLSYSSEPYRAASKRNIQSVMELFYGITIKQYPESNVNKKENIEELYCFISDIQLKNDKLEKNDVQHKSLIPTLRPYQANAVRWMLKQESNLNKLHSQGICHSLFMKIYTQDKKLIYYNRYGGFFTREEPKITYQPSGGILADEMGLGKTVEVLACILWNQRNLKTDDEIETISDETIILDKEDILNDIDSTDFQDIVIKKSKSKRKKKSICKDDDYTEINGFDKLESNHEFLECLCGALENEFEYKVKLQCENCGLWQHLECIEKKYHPNYNALEKHYCPHCWVLPSRGLYTSRATLIVTPTCIKYQWEEEIEKHVKQKSLRVLVYYGVHSQFIPPPVLADYDIVLTTYSVLRRELNYVDLPHSNDDSGRRFRNPKRFMTIPSPLLSIEWWRICLDEAQMVESTTTKTAEMAQRLTSVHRWCVTGTPIQKSIDDLFGLLLFLGVNPFCVKTWWKEIVLNPYCHGEFQPLYEVLNNYFWRTAKKDVIDQLGIPEQEVKVHWLSFSPVEDHFYFRQHQECSQEAMRKINKFRNLDIKLSSLDRHSSMQLLYPLRRLRQACCHPQAVRGEFLPIQKSTLTMEEILTSLIKKVKIECEEAHRQSIAALNGLAGIHIIREEYVEAVEKYREVLKSVEDHSTHIKTDKLQQLHTLHNLAEILEGRKSDQTIQNATEVEEKEKTSHNINKQFDFSNGNDKLQNQDFENNLNIENYSNGSTESSVNKPKFNPPPGVGRTLNDDNLLQQASKLRSLYLSKCLSQVTSAQEQLTQATSNAKEIRSQFVCQKEPWWDQAIRHSVMLNEDDLLVQKVKDDLLENRTAGMLSAVHKFHNVHGMQYIIATMLDDLQNSYQKLSSAVRKLSATPSSTDLNTAVDCHLRPVGKNKVKCIYCQVHELFNHYEGKLFYFSEDVAVSEPTTSDVALLKPLRRGTWADSELELMLKLILNFAKSHGVKGVIIQDGNLHIKLFEALKKEFRALRAVWMQIRDHASAIDELDMATLRFRVRYNNEPQPEIPVPYILEKEEVEFTRLKLMSELAVSKSDLRKKLGQLFYLQNLAKADFGCKGGSNPDTCPVCRHVLGIQWNVLQCGHCFCVSCIHLMISNYSTPGRNRCVRCPVCRQLTSHAEISFVNIEENNDESQIPVKGSHSTKVEGIIRCLLEIKQQDSEAKILVFSTWQDVLDVLSRAMSQNKISYIMLHSRPEIVENLTRFRLDPEITALLLPIRSGANGLNLIEATHVILVEPLLNYASELQAIGRIHRIGQTKPTTVHRFIVRKTIEENMHHMLQTNHSTTTIDTEDNNITLFELQQLFNCR
ncbi:E3 ubiquitin-protein ligase SHPRH [Centruroides vittatus]|uniref:E3 ubiquitin-protein ligase SHPRH n=1 Tax=Centruroides vittatus TaxID=120091 RepID=UPI0035102486